MKKIIALLLAAIDGARSGCLRIQDGARRRYHHCRACSGTGGNHRRDSPLPRKRPRPLRKKLPLRTTWKHVVYIVNGNLGDKSFFDSAQAGITQADRRRPHHLRHHRAWRSGRRPAEVAVHAVRRFRVRRVRPRHLRHLPDARLPEGSRHRSIPISFT
ncbi:MAG: hypothetical protein ACLUFI_02810 [Oscillospiraceae bacterium]